ncbi:hypothetical protein CCAX7_32080 [Capsulimonas corticalis]|uniref:Uncharacterized protein n=1 Tax=Capsulimonas corticalis TaxID=2219043 RepID=A0A402D440_9BACT|nr:MarR family transcriptional regulator [Capsulimonas corticalis]BDI31157.1 hypothetical protein CCAX7_32080 [Capsulimonas corticalis]
MNSQKNISRTPRSRRKNITDQRQTFGALLRGPYQILSASVYGQMSEVSGGVIRPAHGVVFRTISPDGSRVTEMAEQAQMTKQSMGYLVDYLREHRYVEYKDDPTDGRAKLAHLTPSGLAVQQAAMEKSAELENQVAQLMGPGEMLELRRLLEILNARMMEQTQRR